MGGHGRQLGEPPPAALSPPGSLLLRGVSLAAATLTSPLLSSSAAPFRSDPAFASGSVCARTAAESRTFAVNLLVLHGGKVVSITAVMGQPAKIVPTGYQSLNLPSFSKHWIGGDRFDVVNYPLGN